MLLIVFIILAVFYLAWLIYISKLIFSSLIHEASRESGDLIGKYQELLTKKNQIDEERKELEDESSNIFTLYEITKEVAKNLDEQEAFNVLKQKLEENMKFEECRLVDSLSNEIKELKKDDNYFLFNLQDKRRKLGVIAIKCLKDSDREKFMILGHQFALAIRRIKLYKEIEQLAITDSLTGAHTRRYFLERFQEELKRSKLSSINLSFLMIDVDKFKEFNDQYGHLTGDQILREIGAIIKENVREIDILGRYGGEEFSVVLPDTGPKGAHYVAERIRSMTEKTLIRAYDATIKSTLSIGIATYPKDGKIAKELMDKADWALYRAKSMGRNRVCVFGVYQEN